MSAGSLARRRAAAITPSRRRALALTSVVLANAMAVVDYNIVSVAIPQLLRAFPGSTLAGLSWTITAYTVVFAAVLLPAGGMADRLGPKRIFLAGLAVFTLGSAACAAASPAHRGMSVLLVEDGFEVLRDLPKLGYKG
ncbi:MFS transporter, partial [Actinomadura geliboluensis]